MFTARCISGVCLRKSEGGEYVFLNALGRGSEMDFKCQEAACNKRMRSLGIIGVHC